MYRKHGRYKPGITRAYCTCKVSSKFDKNLLSYLSPKTYASLMNHRWEKCFFRLLRFGGNEISVIRECIRIYEAYFTSKPANDIAWQRDTIAHRDTI